MRRDGDLAKTFEATLLRPVARAADIDALCAAASDGHYAGVVVFPCWVSRARARLTGTDVRITAAIAFPYGGEAARTKAIAADLAVAQGADEVEVVALLPALASGDLLPVRDELAAIVRAVRLRSRDTGRDVLVKAIVETCYLDEAGKRLAAEAVESAGCDAIVTSTGVGPEGATEHDVSLLRGALPAHVGVKAAGGILSLADARLLLAAGASRLGAPASAVYAILAEAEETDGR